MFESDDFDQVLSQFDYTENIHSPSTQKKDEVQHSNKCVNVLQSNNYQNVLKTDSTTTKQFDEYDRIEIFKENDSSSPERNEIPRVDKKRLLGSLFDHQSKRKFPGPAGLLSHSRSHHSDDDLSLLEISSQDVDLSQEPLHPSVFELSLWSRLQDDVKLLGVDKIETIHCIKHQDLAGRLPSRKAHSLVAFVEAVHRSVDDHMIVLRDTSGSIKCTLHRDAWSSFAPCIMSEYAALALWKPTVLTTGTTFKKHYLTITLSNIIALYYSRKESADGVAIELPPGYSKTMEDEYAAIRLDNSNSLINNAAKRTNTNQDTIFESPDILEGLDSVSFLDEAF